MDSRIASTASSPTWQEVCEVGQDLHRVRLGGFFGPTWMASLCKGIAAHGLSIRSAHAMRNNDRSWLAELTLLAVPGASEPRDLPYLALARSMEAPSPSRLRLNRFALTQTLDHGGTLKLEIEADDETGLLGALLSLLAAHVLLPVEMHIETRGPCAHDCLWLTTIHDAPPSDVLHRTLAELLDGCLDGAQGELAHRALRQA